MIKTYICEECGHFHEVWRQLSKNMPDSTPCESPIENLDGSGCPGVAFPDEHIYAPGVMFKGGGWTPSTHQKAGEVMLDLGGDGADD